MIGSALALASAIVLTVPPHLGQDVSLVNIVGGIRLPFSALHRELTRGRPDGTYRNDVRFTGTRARARAGGSAGAQPGRRAPAGHRSPRRGNGSVPGRDPGRRPRAPPRLRAGRPRGVDGPG